MHVVITGPSLNAQGGVATYLHTLLPLLESADGITSEYVTLGSARERRGVLYPIEDQLRVLRALRRRPDLIHVNPSLDGKSFLRDGLIVRQARYFDVPSLVFFHGWSLDFERFADRYLKWIFRQTFAHASAFAVLASTFERTLRTWGIERAIYRPYYVVPENLIDGLDREPRRATDDRLRVLFLSRLEREKGVLETLDAVACQWRNRRRVSLTIAGDGPMAGELRKRIQILGLPDDVVRVVGHITGQVKLRAFREHDVLCLPTYYGEGMPLAILEGMAVGMPIVTCTTAGMRDFFIDERMGCLVEPGSVKAIARALERIQTRPEWRRDVSHFNRKFAEAHCSAPAVVQELRAIYDSIANMGPCRS